MCVCYPHVEVPPKSKHPPVLKATSKYNVTWPDEVGGGGSEQGGGGDAQAEEKANAAPEPIQRTLSTSSQVLEVIGPIPPFV